MFNMRIKGLIFLCALTLILALHSPAWGQGSSTSIIGTVTDPSGAVVPQVEITVKNLATGAENSATTDQSGNYLITPLPAGQYSFAAKGGGFKAFVVGNISLAIGDRFRQDVKLEVGAVGESIEVTAQTAALQTDTSSLGSLINQRAVQDLPINGRNFVVLAQFAAGANEGESNGLASGTRPDDRRQTSGISVNSQPSSYNNFLIDGMDDNVRSIGSIVVKPSIDALVEMRVQTNLYSAEFGRTAGGMVNFITKSGVNDVHGSAFEFLRNEKMDAMNVFAQGGKPSYKQNQFGGSLGGPIRKNGTFFFGDYEGTRLRQGQTYTSLVPTLDMRNGIFGSTVVVDPLTRVPFPNNSIPLTSMDKVGYNLVQLYPKPNASGSGYNFVTSPNKTQTNDTFDARVDHRFANSDSIFGRYSFNNTDTYLPGALPVDPVSGIQAVGDPGTFAGPAKQRAWGAQLNFVHLFGPTLVMELKSGFNRYENHALPPNFGNNADDKIGLKGINIDATTSGLSNVTVSGGYRGLGDANFIPIIDINNTWQHVGSLTLTRGSHTIKVGGDVRRRQITLFQSNQPRGSFAFDANLAGQPVASLLMGYPATTTLAKLMVWPGWRLWEGAAYLQDDWRVTHWLTLNLGVRWDYLGPITEVANRISNIDPWAGKFLIAGQDGVSASAGVQANVRDFSPRFGFAATLSPGTVLRGGYGINYVPQFLGGQYNLRNPPFVSLYSAAATTTVPVNRLQDGLPPLVATDPLNARGNVTGVARDASTPYVEQYNLTLQRELGHEFVLTVGYAASLGRRQYMFNASGNMNQPLPGSSAAIQGRRPFVSVFPNLGNISIYAPWYNSDYHGLQTTIERRFSKGFSLLGTFTWAHSIDDYTQQNPYNRAAERGNSYLDQRRRFTLLTNYQLPFGKGRKSAAAILARDWSVNAIVVLNTGLPFNITNASAQSNTGATDRPDALGDPLAGFEQTPSRWFNTAVFGYQAKNTFGNVGRNLLHAPGRADLDLSIHREIPLRENVRLQFRAEAFNVTNTPPFNAPAGAYAPGSTTFGVITSAGLPRNIQMALKLLF